MLALFRGEPLVRAAARSFLEAGLVEVILVLGSRSDEVARAVEGLGVQTLVNPNWEDGMFSSVRTGLLAAAAGSARIALSPSDLPYLTSSDVRRVCEASLEKGANELCVPISDGRRGHPLLFSMELRSRILSWPGTARLSDLFLEPDLTLCPIEGFGREILHDIDSPEDLAVEGIAP